MQNSPRQQKENEKGWGIYIYIYIIPNFYQSTMPRFIQPKKYQIQNHAISKEKKNFIYTYTYTRIIK